MISPLRTLRFRLTLWYCFVLMGALGGLGVLVYSVLRYQLLRHHDGELREAAAAVVEVLSVHEDCEHLTADQQASLDRLGRLVLVHEVGGERRVFYRSRDTVGVELPFDLDVPEAQLAAPPTFETCWGPGGIVRVYSVPYRSRIGRRGIIRVMQPLGDVSEPMHALRDTLLLTTPFALAVAFAGGFLLARRALRPVDRVSRLAREIEASNLSRRLPESPVDDEIGRLVGTFNQMIARLEASFEGMKRFTADASHELRSPLATMRGTIDVVLDRPREPEEYRQALQSVGEDVDRLRYVVDDLLVLARADAGRLPLQRAPLQLRPVVADVVEAFQARAAELGVRLVAGRRDDLTIVGDERWLRQLLTNLVENALKFSAGSERTGGPEVRVELKAAPGVAVIAVLDSGPGIPDEALDKVFQRFYRVDAARRHGGAEGHGLGLAIAAWIVHEHGGRILAENRADGGTIFTATLPVAA
jgi:heavy metal sensor kinase